MTSGPSHRSTPARTLAAGLAIAGLLCLPAAEDAIAEDCPRSDFEAVVDQSAEALRGLNMKNKPALQEKLRQLRDKRGWSNDQFLKEAAPFVRDETIDELDRRSSDHLRRITSMGQQDPSAKPDCKLLAELRSAMAELVETQAEKWRYIFGKLDAALDQ